MELHKDDKVLTAWNGLMTSAMAKAYVLLKEENYLKMAEDAASFIEKNLTERDGTLKIRWRDGESAGYGTLDEYAFYIWGLLELYEGTEKETYKDRAYHLTKHVIENFWDDRGGGFFLTGKYSEKLIFRPKESYDGAMPSGNSVMAGNLIKLRDFFEKENGASKELEDKTEKLMQFLTRESKEYPAGFSYAMLAMMKYLK